MKKMTLNKFTFSLHSKPIEEELEEYASKIFMCRAILESIIPAFISFLIGPWSDKFGRKPILLSTFFGKHSNFFVSNKKKHGT